MRIREISSVGRAVDLHSSGQRFEPSISHRMYKGDVIMTSPLYILWSILHFSVSIVIIQALVVQWIEQRTSKPLIVVRFHSGAQTCFTEQLLVLYVYQKYYELEGYFQNKF